VSLVAGPGANPDPVEPVQAVSMLNSLCPMASNGDHCFTMSYGLLNVRARLLRFTAAGHPAPIMVAMGVVLNVSTLMASPSA